jgi:hypothetical protein
MRLRAERARAEEDVQGPADQRADLPRLVRGDGGEGGLERGLAQRGGAGEGEETQYVVRGGAAGEGAGEEGRGDGRVVAGRVFGGRATGEDVGAGGVQAVAQVAEPAGLGV